MDGSSSELSVNQYSGAIHPSGHQYLKAFRLDPFPVFTYEVEGVELEKSLFFVHGENTVVVQYRVSPGQVGERKVELTMRPLIAFRDYHGTTHENQALSAHLEVSGGQIKIKPYSTLPELCFAHNATGLEQDGFWYRNFEYVEERRRGLDCREDLYSPFAMRFDLSREPTASLIASLNRKQVKEAAVFEQAERQRREATVANIKDEFVRDLTAAADQYVVSRGRAKSIIAGYHWFADWGRDTMIALPGLTLATGRYDVARSILWEFSRYVDQGMLPNRFPDAGETPEYNTVDATLWFFEAIRQYVEKTGDFEFVRRELYPALTSIIEFHLAGTRYGIKVDTDGLLNCGEPGVQLTWMDAKIGDWVVTPRQGKPVEIQSLWYNALRTMEHLAMKFRDPATQKTSASLAREAANSFNQKFWNTTEDCLLDVVGPNGADPSIRPNQILAVSLHYSMLDNERASLVVAMVEQELLTPFGLRTLAPSDPQYRPHYGGDPNARDSAYHQGTVWPWLLGPFLDAYLRVHDWDEAARSQALQWLEPLRERMSEFGLGQIAEVCDAEAPRSAGGCIAQAWSVAQILGVLTRLSSNGLRTE